KRALLHGSLQLPAGCVDVSSPGPADEGRDAGVAKDLLELQHASLLGGRKINSGTGIESYQVHFAADAADQLNHLPGMARLVVYATKQDGFKGDTFAVAQWKLPRGLHQNGQIPFSVDGHDSCADLVVGSVEGNGQLGTDRFVAEINNAGHNTGG